MPKRIPWVVFVTLDDDEVDAMRVAAGAGALGTERFRFEAVSPPLGPGTDLLIQVDAVSMAQAKALAEQALEHARARADVAVASVDVAAIARLREASAPPRHFELRRYAHQLVADEHLELGVIVAQSACELYIEAVMSMLMISVMPSEVAAAASHGLGYSLRNPRAQGLWAALLGDPIQQTGDACWNPYRDHVDRRNAIAHQGVEITLEEAAESMRAMESLFAYVAARDEATTGIRVDLESGLRQAGGLEAE